MFDDTDTQEHASNSVKGTTPPVDDEIEEEDVIQAVKARPVLWDKTTEEYRNSVAKKAAWDEVGTIFNKSS